MPPQTNNLRSRILSPAGTLGMALSAAILLTLLPAAWTAAMRDTAATALKPGQRLALAAGGGVNRVTTRLKSHFQSTSRLADARHQVEQLQRENKRLTVEIDALRAAAVDARQRTPQRLLSARCVEANVLGRQARAFLARHYLLDAGSEQGIAPEALVVAAGAIIDRGTDARFQPGQLVLAGRAVWGKIVQLGPHTSTVRTLTEPGYRDLVRLGTATGPQGVLEGTGEPLARVRLVEVTEPVSVGDPVFAAAGKGVLSPPPVYGRVARLERPAAAAHWEIWVQPALTDEPQQVAVLRLELNPSRVAGGE